MTEVARKCLDPALEAMPARALGESNANTTSSDLNTALHAKQLLSQVVGLAKKYRDEEDEAMMNAYEWLYPELGV